MAEEPTTLIRRAQQGDREALEMLLARHLPALRGYVRLRGGRLLRAKESSTDLVQSVCREILEHLDRFRHPSEEGFRQWLYVTALRKIQSRHHYYRAQKRDVALEADDASLVGCYASFCTPSGEAAAREEIARIERAFDALPESDREVILLARLVGLSRAAIGERLGISEGAVRTRLSRALARLAEALDEA